MTGEQLLKHLKAQPFMPFALYLADGRVLKVGHPEFVLYVPGMRTCVVADLKEKAYDTIDLLLVTSIRTWEGNGKLGGARKRR